MKRYQSVLVEHGAPELPAGYMYDVYPYDSGTIAVEVRKRIFPGLWVEKGISYGENRNGMDYIAALCKAAWENWQWREGNRYGKYVA